MILRPPTTESPAQTLLSIRGLTTSFFTFRGVVEALSNVSFDLKRGEMVGIVGETGAGKTTLVHSIVNQVRFPGRIVHGDISLDGVNLRSLNEKQMAAIRGKRIALIVSNPRASLDPLETIGHQLARAIVAHDRGASHSSLRDRVLEALRDVRIPDPRRRYSAYPHELSVGMAQRVLIAMALVHKPELILADEPTAGLDVTVQIQVLNLMKILLDQLQSSTLIVTRDLGIVARYCDRIGVMKGGELVEQTSVASFFRSPAHPYSKSLLARTIVVDKSIRPDVGHGEATSEPSKQSTQPLLSVRDLVKHFPIRGSRLTVKAVNGVSFDVMPGEALGLVGESGSGKTTLGRLLLRLIEPTSGTIDFETKPISGMGQRQLRGLRERIQMVFQEPHASLNPYMSIAQNIEQPLILQRKLPPVDRRNRVRELLRLVQLSDRHLAMYPHNLSAGQAQRVGIARAIATNPRLIVLDEPTSLLDIAVRGDILDLLNRIKEELSIAYIFISHDLTAVRSVCTRIAIMYLGKIVEAAEIERVFALQRHPYSKALLASVLVPDPRIEASAFYLSGEIPSPVDLPKGCSLAGRCPLARPACEVAPPPLARVAPDWYSACYFSDELVLKSERFAAAKEPG